MAEKPSMEVALPGDLSAQTIASMAASARACAVAHRPAQEILDECKAIGRAMAGLAFYELEFKNKRGQTSIIRGASTHLAEAVFQAHGNAFLGSQYQSETETAFQISALFVNSRTGAMRCMSYRQPKRTPGTAAAFRDDPERGLSMAYQIGESKATRNVVGKSLKFYIEAAYREAVAAAEKAKQKRAPKPGQADLENEWRRAHDLGITARRFFEFVAAKNDKVGERTKLDEIAAVLTWTDIDRLSNALTAIESGDVDAAEVFGTNGNGGETDETDHQEGD